MRGSLGCLAALTLLSLAGAPWAAAEGETQAPASPAPTAVALPGPVAPVGGTEGPQDHASPSAEEAAQAKRRELTPEEAERQRPLRERVEARWQAVIARDFAKAYEYESPEYRNAHSVKEYAGQFGSLINWDMATVKEVRYDRENEAEVFVEIGFNFPLGGDDQPVHTSTELPERWVFSAGQWWRLDNRQPLGADELPTTPTQE